MIKTHVVIVFILLNALISCTSINNKPNVLIDENKQIEVAIRAENSNQLSAALRIYQQLQETAKKQGLKESDDVLLGLGRIYYQQGLFNQSYQSLYYIQPTSPLYQEANITIVRTLLRMGRVEEAEERLEGVSSDFKNKEFYLLQGVIWDNQKKHALAQSIYIDLLVKDPFDMFAQENLSRSYFLQNKLKKAEKGFVRLLEFNPRDESIIRLLALCYYQQGLNDSALQVLATLDNEYASLSWLEKTSNEFHGDNDE